MYLTLESDYAIRILVFLIRHGARADAKLISENTGVTLRFALKILRKLVGGGFVKSFKGTQGGYEMARKPEEINLADVIETIEESYCLSRCLKDGEVCPRGMAGTCKVSEVFDEISGSVREKLSKTTFDQLV